MTSHDVFRPVVLVILDGWGIEAPGVGNAITLADTPVFDNIWRNYPHATLKTSGLDVGLTEGQMGNSEVGHTNLGAGFVVHQTLTRINLDIDEGTFFQNEVLNEAIRVARERGSQLHLMGLLSDGGVHSHIDHVKALITLCKRKSFDDVVVHAFLDGRDTSPHGGVAYLAGLLEHMHEEGTGKLASIVGRYYAMDRDRRWGRTRAAFDLLVSAEGDSTSDPLAKVRERYEHDQTDEFMQPIVVLDDDQRATRITDGDVIVFFNFRADRGRQLTSALTGTAPDEAEMPASPSNLHVVTMTEYDAALPVHVAFTPQSVEHPLARVLSEAGRTQFHTAETEKYAHVTYFFNGGREEPFDGEDREMVQSPMVATYDKQPEMSAAGVATCACSAIESGAYDFVVLNFANCDMVGHTGILKAAIEATEAVDAQLKRILDATLGAGGVAIVTADHGNAEQMLVPGTGAPMTAHTTNPVPVVLVMPDESPIRRVALRDGGRLADIAPTVLDLMGIPQPDVMSGRSLLAPD